MKIKQSFGPSYNEFEVGDVVFLAQEEALQLDSGAKIQNFPIAYQSYGQLNVDKSNAVLICHALTGDQYVASNHPITGKEGWWDNMVGAGKPIDTDKFFVICSNVIGGCMGSFGPKSINETTGKPYALDFPVVTIQDMVRAQNLLIEHLGIKKLHAVIGGSTGGMQAMAWASLYPEKVNLVMPIAASYRHSPQNIAFHEVGRQAIIADDNWCDGNYLAEKKYPAKGLSVARMTAHVTYLSEKALQRKFGRKLQDKDRISFSFAQDFRVESYLHYQGSSFVERFDANSYLYITRAVDYFDLESDNDGSLAQAFSGFSRNKGARFCIASFSDDWLFPPEESKKLACALLSCGADVSTIVIDSNAGHDAFLLKNEILERAVRGFINTQKT